jgi:hypothetical protein
MGVLQYSSEEGHGTSPFSHTTELTLRSVLYCVVVLEYTQIRQVLRPLCRLHPSPQHLAIYWGSIPQWVGHPRYISELLYSRKYRCTSTIIMTLSDMCDPS